VLEIKVENSRGDILDLLELSPLLPALQTSRLWRAGLIAGDIDQEIHAQI
jgi:hypothetical protein